RDCGEQREKRLQRLQGDLRSIRSPHTDSDFFAQRNRPPRFPHQDLENCCIWDSVESVEQPWIVDLCRGESFGFLGFDFRRVRSLRGRWRAHYTPTLKKRTALLAKLKDVFRRHQSQPVDRVIKLINPVLRGWV